MFPMVIESYLDMCFTFGNKLTEESAALKKTKKAMVATV